MSSADRSQYAEAVTRAVPQRNKSHKLLKDMADLHALLWYVTDYDEMRTAISDWLTEGDIADFTVVTNDDLHERTAGLIDVDPAIVRQSIEGVVT